MISQPKLVIIDDEEVVLDSCTLILADSGYDIAVARDGREGLSLVQEYKPDLVFVDLKMPGISGFEVLEKIRELDPTIVCIVITGFGTVSSAVDSMKKGAFDFLPKPFTPDELRLITQRALEKRRLVLESIALRREKEMLREHFAAIVAHELKSPLNALQQNLYALALDLSNQLTAEQRNRLERCQARVDDLLKLVNTWLRAMSTDIGKIRETFKPVSVQTVIEKARESVQPHADRKGIEIVSELAGAVDPVFGDEGTLVEAVVNLLSNAVKYSHFGDQVRIRCEQSDDQVALSVIDTGVGIAKEDLPFIFEDFYHSRVTDHGETSSGLGLALARRIIQAHDGSISVVSEPGRGSTFTIHLPVLKKTSLETEMAAPSLAGGN